MAASCGVVPCRQVAVASSSAQPQLRLSTKCPLRTSHQARAPLQASPQRPQRVRHAARAPSSRAAHVGGLVATELKVAVVVARFNDLVTKLLLEGAKEGLERHGCTESNVEVVWVPGSFELPLVAKGMAKSGAFDAVITLGAVVRGATTHYDAVVGGATSGVLNAATDSGVPVVFGVLTCDTMEQALDRAGGKVGNKGYEAAVTAVEMSNLVKDLRQKGIYAEKW